MKITMKTKMDTTMETKMDSMMNLKSGKEEEVLMNKKNVINGFKVFGLVVFVAVMGFFAYDIYSGAKEIAIINGEYEASNNKVAGEVETLTNNYEELNATKEELTSNKNTLETNNAQLNAQVSTLTSKNQEAKEYVCTLFNNLEYSQDNSQPLTAETRAMLDEIEHLTYDETTPDRQARLFLYAFHYAIPQEVKDEFFEDGYTITLAAEPTMNNKGYIQLNYGYGIVLFQTDLTYSYVLCHEMGHYIDVKTRSLDGEFSDPCSYDAASLKEGFSDEYYAELDSPFESYVDISYHNQRKEFFANSYAMYELYYDKYIDSHPQTFAFIDDRLAAFK